MAQDRSKILFVMIDGLADVSIPKFNRKTSLQRAVLPTMDAIANSGINGAMDPVEPGYSCGSDTAHLSIFGYDPRLYYRGRGAFEVMGAGLDMIPGDIAFKSNFATLDKDNATVISRRADRNFEHLGPTLCEALTGIKLPSFQDYQVDIKYATEHRCGVRVRGPGLTDAISNTDPLKDNLPLLHAMPLNESKEAEFTAHLVNELSDKIREVLEHHKINEERAQQNLPLANVVLLRGCGVRAQVPTFKEKYKLKSFMIAPTCIIAGLGMSIGIEVIKAPGATGDYHTDLDSKGNVAVETLTNGDYDFGFLHIKGVDDAGHDKDPDLKIQLLEKIDAMLKTVVERLAAAEHEGKGKFSICLTGDHTTPVLSGDHSCEPVPFTISKPVLVDQVLNPKEDVNISHWTFTDTATTFDEIECIKGALGRFPGSQVMGIVTQYMSKNL